MSSNLFVAAAHMWIHRATSNAPHNDHSDLIRAAIAKRHGDADKRRVLTFMLADEHLRNGDFEGAMELLKHAHNENKSDIFCLLKITDLFLYYSKNYEMADYWISLAEAEARKQNLFQATCFGIKASIAISQNNISALNATLLAYVSSPPHCNADMNWEDDIARRADGLAEPELIQRLREMYQARSSGKT